MSAESAPAPGKPRIAAERVRAYATAVMAAAGCVDAEAALVADVLVEADLRGVFSHGLMRLTPYTEEIAEGKMRPGATIPELHAGPAFAVFDAQQALGPCSAKVAMERAIDLARQGAAAFAFVHNGTHFGPAAHWVLLAAEAGCIGFATSSGGGRSRVLAFGSRRPALTNGPIAWGIPAGRHPAIVADMAVGAAAMGKVRVAEAAGQPIPDHWGLDADGNPTSDPSRLAYLNPFAGPKGFGLGIVMETLSGILAGAKPAPCRAPEDPKTVGQVFGAVNIEAFRPLDDFLIDVDATIDSIHGLQPAPGVDRVLVPGEPEWIKRARALAEGIDYPPGLLDAVEATGRRLGVAPVWS